jgi:uncharacterized membrane protein
MAMLEQTQQHLVGESRDTLGIELLIARLYRWGVALSFAIVVVGVALLLLTRQSGYPQAGFDDISSILQYRVNPNFPNSLSDVFTGVLVLKPFAIISLGLLVLIALPVLRVALTVAAFARQRDWVYLMITAFVLAMLLLSFAIGEIGG